jgi:aubergine
MDVSVRVDTVWDNMCELYQQNRTEEQYRDAVRGQFLGQIVLTRYNNRTYRIDGIDFDKSPLSTFTKRTGETMSYQQYYAAVYNRTLRETRQPLLIHKQRRRVRHRHTSFPVYGFDFLHFIHSLEECVCVWNG